MLGKGIWEKKNQFNSRTLIWVWSTWSIVNLVSQDSFACIVWNFSLVKKKRKWIWRLLSRTRNRQHSINEKISIIGSESLLGNIYCYRIRLLVCFQGFSPSGPVGQLHCFGYWHYFLACPVGISFFRYWKCQHSSAILGNNDFPFIQLIHKLLLHFTFLFE